ncbi:MAG: flavodoxin-dependent (E)-4-hydroxy-3-methylbut-2-enyl-diphosphate synthase [Peptococcaceae bacterium]|nr:MAG: flavodoxin-dependent (E)-4-hydroxy-3-methylbut-2-enyl-diphosphate synthase [Peptococcaceae bacterium]
MSRRITRPVRVGPVQVGGGAPVSVQSMTKTDTRDAAATIRQINELAAAGCEIVRLAIPDHEAAAALKAIRREVSLPLVADIHFDYRLALEALVAGVDGLRINPGNIGSREKVATIVDAARDRGAPIRIGVNAGSLEKRLLERYGGVTAEAMVESALHHVGLLEGMNFDAIKISLKSSDLQVMLEAYRLLAKWVDYPFHIGVTEAGTVRSGTVKSAIGIGILLYEGIGDTIRVSLTGHPTHEVRVGYDILRSLGLRRRGVELISCPTCGRCRLDLVRIAETVEERLRHVDRPLKVAVMGCSVNGPGEAREADVGIAGGRGEALVFCKGEIVRKVPEEKIVDELFKEIAKLTNENV